MKFMFFLLAFLFSTATNAQFIGGKFSAGGEYNHWKPLDLAAVEITTEGYQVGYAELALQFAGFTVSKLRYETNFGGTNQDEIIALQENEGEFAKYENFIGIVNFSRFVVKYNKETYVSEVKAVNNFQYVNRDGAIQRFNVGQNASFSTQFESFFIGLDNLVPYASAGVFYSTYKKPYFLTDNNRQDRSTMFYGEFSSYGFEMLKQGIPTEELPFAVDYGLKFGWGDVDLGVAGSVSDGLSGTDRVSYFEATLAPHWNKNIGDKIAFNLGVEATYKFFFKGGNGETTTIGEDRGFNSDITAKVLASAVYRF